VVPFFIHRNSQIRFNLADKTTLMRSGWSPWFDERALDKLSAQLTTCVLLAPRQSSPRFWRLWTSVGPRIHWVVSSQKSTSPCSARNGSPPQHEQTKNGSTAIWQSSRTDHCGCCGARIYRGCSTRKRAEGLSFSVINHLRWDLRQIFGLAMAEGFVDRNPTEFLFTPRDARRIQKRQLTWVQVQGLFVNLGLRERRIVSLALVVGMRPGEIFTSSGGTTRGPRSRWSSACIEGRLMRHSRSGLHEKWLFPEVLRA